MRMPAWLVGRLVAYWTTTAMCRRIKYLLSIHTRSLACLLAGWLAHSFVCFASFGISENSSSRKKEREKNRNEEVASHWLSCGMIVLTKLCNTNDGAMNVTIGNNGMANPLWYLAKQNHFAYINPSVQIGRTKRTSPIYLLFVCLFGLSLSLSFFIYV